MAMSTTSANRAFLPTEIGPLVVQPVIEEAVATQVATVVQLSDGIHDFRVPIVSDDPTAEWVAEGEEITPTDATLDEELVTFAKLAGLSIISRELAEDSSPAAAQVVGRGLARDIARKLDVAFFGNEAAPAPAGLESITPTDVDSASYANLDPFLEAISEAEQVGATIAAFVTDPATALGLAQLKVETGSALNVLQPDPTMPTRRLVAGVPLLSSSAVTAGTVWGIPRDRVMVVLRHDTRLEISREAYFSSDRVGIRATMRVGFAFPHEDAVVKIAAAA